ncbi:MAG TPA: hypothetical protein VND87_04505 [Stellaceae bacterium]|nr:hypothetical protein [Stellaceae bacterium]
MKIAGHTGRVSPVLWHAHEMLFGVAGPDWRGSLMAWRRRGRTRRRRSASMSPAMRSSGPVWWLPRGVGRRRVWCGCRVPRAPGVWILHLAYLWLVLGLLLAAAVPLAGAIADMLASAVVWALGFVVFLIGYLPGVMLPRQPRLDLDQGARGDAGQ